MVEWEISSISLRKLWFEGSSEDFDGMNIKDIKLDFSVPCKRVGGKTNQIFVI